MQASSLLEAGSKVGRSFSLATFLPTSALLLWIAFVATLSPTFGGPLTWPSGGLPVVDWLTASLAGAAFLLLALALHPLVFATTQALEGYWGPTAVATLMAARASGRHRARLHKLEALAEKHTVQLEERSEAAYRQAGAENLTYNEWMSGWLDAEENQTAQAHILIRDAAAKARERYPERASRVLPTALGNALRREEDRIGAQYGLDALTVAGHLAVLLPPDQADYLDDSRQQLDTAVRLCAAALLAFVATVGWLIVAGSSLLLALVPLCFAFVSYQSAVAAAQEYMYVFGVMVDLNRFALYKAMHLSAPENGQREVVQNEQLMQLLSGIRTNMAYEIGEVAPAGAGAASTAHKTP
ncbi:MAG: hypothetical protein M3256_03130 [Actinomycetota bacterium]|nr:hypothetical protein [Actinomycetota bacterium]